MFACGCERREDQNRWFIVARETDPGDGTVMVTAAIITALGRGADVLLTRARGTTSAEMAVYSAFAGSGSIRTLRVFNNGISRFAPMLTKCSAD